MRCCCGSSTTASDESVVVFVDDNVVNFLGSHTAPGVLCCEIDEPLSTEQLRHLLAVMTAAAPPRDATEGPPRDAPRERAKPALLLFADFDGTITLADGLLNAATSARPAADVLSVLFGNGDRQQALRQLLHALLVRHAIYVITSNRNLNGVAGVLNRLVDSSQTAAASDVPRVGFVANENVLRAAVGQKVARISESVAAFGLTLVASVPQSWADEIRTAGGFRVPDLTPVKEAAECGELKSWLESHGMRVK